jgi:hypothetical protein
MLLNWDDEDCLGPYQPSSRSTLYVNATAWSRGLEVAGGGAADAGGGLDRGRVFADLSCAIADGALVISDFRVIGDQHEVFGQVASVPTAWRTLKEAAVGGDRTRRLRSPSA